MPYTSPRKFVRFTGKLTDLIPAGWTFWKAYARNYRVYSKTSNGEKYGPNFSIWQHLGGYVEFADYYGDTYLIFDLIKSGKIKDHLWFGKDKPSWTDSFFGQDSDNHYRFVINSDTDAIEAYDRLKHDSMAIHFEGEKQGWPDEKISQLIDELYRKYRTVTIRQHVVDFIQDMFDKGWVEVRLDTEKKMFRYA